LTISNHSGTFFDFLTGENREDLLRGEIALAFSMERQVESLIIEDGYFVGIMDEPVEQKPTEGGQVLVLRGHDPLSLFSRKKFHFPMCFSGARADWACRELCRLAGIPDTQVEFKFTPDPLTDVLDNPERNYYDPVWTADVGTSMLDFLRECLRGLGLRVQCKPEWAGNGDYVPMPKLVFERSDVPATVSMTLADSLTDTTQASFGDTEAGSDNSERYSHVQVIGYTPDGLPISAVQPVPNVSVTPGTTGYVGGVNVLVIKAPDHTTQTTVDKRCTEEVKAVHHPLFQGTLQTRKGGAGGLYPWERVEVIQDKSILSDYAGTAKPYKIAEMTITEGEDSNPVAFRLEDIWDA
jgi:hypothetical protein